MFLHTFDYPTPNETPARSALGLPLGGPWLHPLLRERLPPAAWLPLAHYLVDRLAMILLALPARLPQLHVIDTRGTLIPAHLGATRESNDWDNEIHPNKGGYRKLAARLAAAVQRKLDM
jgi:lysophospholipase L1-like esterase